MVNHRLLVLAAALLSPRAAAQLGPWTWTEYGCATQASDIAVLEVCAGCGGDDSALATTAPDSGLVAFDVAWTTINTCCVQLDVTVTNAGVSKTNVYHQGNFLGPGWCAPNPPPCSGGASVVFPVVKGELIEIRLNAIETGWCIFAPPAATTARFTSFSFVPETLPAILKIDASFASASQAISIYGDNFDAASQVALDGVPQIVLSQSNDKLVIRPGPDIPGWRDVTVTNAVGSTTKIDGLLRWPALSASIETVGSWIDLEVHPHFSGGGTWWLAVAPAALANPIPLPGIEFGLLLDPATGLVVLGKGTLPSTASIGTHHTYVPHDPALSGLAIPVQALAQLHGPGTASFTNLALPIAP